MSTEFTHDTDARRYVMRIDGELIAVIDYVENASSVSFTHTFTSPSRRGHGFAGEVVAFAVDDVEKNRTGRIVPMCWYVADWFEAHPERAHLLTRAA